MLDNGKINFTSNAPLEIIKATSDQMRMVIDPSTNQIGLIVSILSFKGFNGKLQRDHFNEKYMESDKYPNASFNGKIIEKVDFSKDGVYEVRVKGELEIHGQKQTRIIKGKIAIKNGITSIATDFTIPLSDYNISVPSIISEKIASEIQVNVYALVTRVE
jgi:polyisoprenoid-binding protein YceI